MKINFENKIQIYNTLKEWSTT